MSKPRYWLIVPAAGSGQRMKADCPKQYLKLDQQYILDITLSRLLGHADFSGCVVAIRADDPWWPETMASSDTRIDTCSGGAERADSVLSALEALASRADDDDWVLVHDAARPCLHPNDLERLLTQLQDHPVGGLLATPVAEPCLPVTSTQITIAMKQKFFSLSGSDFSIKDMEGNVIAVLDGKNMSMRDRIVLNDASGTAVCCVLEKVFSMSPAYFVYS